MSTLVRLRNIFLDVFDDDAITVSETTSKSTLEDWDSVAHVKLVLAIEEEFGIRFTTEEVASITSVGGFVDAIQRHVEKSL